MVQTLGTAQIQHPGHPLRPRPDPGADGARPEVGAALAGVRHAEGVRHHQAGGADPRRGPEGDEQVRDIGSASEDFFFLDSGRGKKKNSQEVRSAWKLDCADSLQCQRCGRWKLLYEELCLFRSACQQVGVCQFNISHRADLMIFP